MKNSEKLNIANTREGEKIAKYTSMSALKNAIRKEMYVATQQAGYDHYIQQANSVALSQDYKNKVMDGTINIETITDKDLAENIKEYKQWYEKALDCRDAIDELKESVRDLYKEAFDNVSTLYEGMLSQIEHRQKILEGYIEQTETEGYIVSTKYYDALISNEQTKLGKLTKQRQELISAMNDAIANGDIEVESEEWYSMQEKINGVNEAIQDAETSLIEFNNSIRKLKWDIFDKVQDRISLITDEADFLVELMSDEKMYDDKGIVTKHGTATYGLHGVNYNVYMSQADQYRKEMEAIQRELSNDPYNETLIERRNELLELQQESIIAAEKEKEAIRDLVEEGIKKQLEALNDLIDKYLEVIDSQKEMYDYQRKIDSQQKEINSLEKQLSAYAGDDSEEGNAKRQQLRTSLEEARENLEETQYDKAISEQKKLLDELYTEYENILNMRLDNIDQLIAEVIANVNTEGSNIRDTLISESEKVGYKLTDSMNTIWGSGNGIAGILSTYSANFSSTMTTVQAAINDIKLLIQNAVNKSNEKATTNINKANSQQAQQTAKPSTTKKVNVTSTQPKNTNSGGDGVPRIGDAVTYVSGRYYYSSDGLNPSGNQMLGQTVYIGHINNASWAKRPYAIYRDSGFTRPLGWVSLDQIKGYKSGIRSVSKNELAWTNEDEPETIIRESDGAILTKLSPGDSVLSNVAHKNLWDMANDPVNFISKNMGGNSALPTSVPMNDKNNVITNDFNVNIGIDHVEDYNDLVKKLQKDRHFERVIQSMTVDRMMGRSNLGKYNVKF